jgi:hypothetical protein
MVSFFRAAYFAAYTRVKLLNSAIASTRLTGFCATCGYRLRGWRLILGHNRSTRVRKMAMSEVGVQSQS